MSRMYFWATVVSKFRMMADRCCLGRDLLDTINKYMLLVFLSLGQGMDFLLHGCVQLVFTSGQVIHPVERVVMAARRAVE